MLKNGDLTDVTIACEDDQIEAHKVIISAASKVFRNILKKNPHKHPLLYFHDVTKEAMELVLHFVYSGQVTVPLNSVENFFRVANNLKVESLIEVKDKSTGLIRSDTKDDVSDEKNEEFNDNIKDETLPLTVGEQSIEEELDMNIKMESINDNEATSDHKEINTKVESLIVKSEDGTWGCKECNYTSIKRSYVRAHVEQHISGYSHPCNLCSKVCKTRAYLRTHKIRCVRKSVLPSE